jgi:hypothetical protein
MAESRVIRFLVGNYLIQRAILSPTGGTAEAAPFYFVLQAPILGTEVACNSLTTTNLELFQSFLEYDIFLDFSVV